MSKLSKYFSDGELCCKCCGEKKLDPYLERELYIYRETLDFPLFPNSCCRCPKHNANVGGAPNSYHKTAEVDDGREGTLAIDLRVANDAQRAVMVTVALNLGWSVGVYKNFIHIDRRIDIGRAQVCFWGKY